MRQAMIWFNVGLRGLMEAAVVAGFSYWGYHVGAGTGSRILYALLVPMIGFGIWGLVDFRWAGSFAEALRLVEELIVSGLAALALYHAGQHALGLSLAALSVVHHGLTYLLGRRLLE